MSIATEIQRLQQAKADIRDAIISKGVDVPTTDKISAYAEYVESISGGDISTASQSIFTGWTIPIVWSDATEEQRTFEYKSATHNITISGDITQYATIQGNGTKSVKVVVSANSETADFNINCTNSTDNIDYQGKLLAIGTLDNGNCVLICKTTDGYDVLKMTTQPLFSSLIAYILANNKRYYSHQVVSFNFGKMSVTKIDSGFLRNCYQFNQPLIIPSSVTSIGIYFIQNCNSFNQTLTIPNGVTSIGSYFMANCSSFNQPITIPSSVTSIGDNFISNCFPFNQPLTIPSSVTSIGNYFIQGCNSFNQTLTIPDGVTSIGNYFMSGCNSFNQPMTIPSSVTSIGSSFMYQCRSFNQPLTIPSSVTSIGNYFMYECHSFNQPLTIPSSVTSIGNYFIQSCNSFNQTLTIPNGVTSIGDNFMEYCYAFNQPLTIPSSVTSIGNNFMYNCYGLVNLRYDSTTYPTDNISLSQDSNTKTNADYGTGIKVTGAGAEGLKNALPNRTSSPYRKLV